MDLTTRVGRIKIEGVIGNSPGLRKSIEAAEELLTTECSVVTFGSITPRKRMGNALPNHYIDDEGVFTQNYVGLTNLGLATYLPQQIPSLVEQAEENGKHLVMSLAAERVEDLVSMVKQLADFDISIELNLTCPNVETVAGYAIIWAFDLDLVRKTIYEVRQVFSGNLLVKLNYHPDQQYVGEMVEILAEGKVDAVALINTLPLSLIINPDTLKPEMSGNLGFGGLSGRSILPIGLGAVREYARQLPEEISIVGRRWDYMRLRRSGLHGGWCPLLPHWVTV